MYALRLNILTNKFYAKLAILSALKHAPHPSLRPGPAPPAPLSSAGYAASVRQRPQSVLKPVSCLIIVQCANHWATACSAVLHTELDITALKKLGWG